MKVYRSETNEDNSTGSFYIQYMYSPLIDGLESDLIRHSICLFQKEDDPGSPVRPLFCQVDPWRQPVPVENYVIGPQQTPCHQWKEEELVALDVTGLLLCVV